MENDNVQFTESQQQAWDLLENTNENVFLTGEAGSGKSFIIREFIKDKDPKEFPVLASTGAAAVLIGGRTFHSFMGLGIMEGGVDATIERALSDKRLVGRLKKAHGFILDEVSMISGPTLRAAEIICRLARNELEQPWGGLRVVAVGDFAQLPPITKNFSFKAWAFLDPAWRASRFKTVLLTQNMRSQEDHDFLRILNEVRRGTVTEEVRDFLDSRTGPVCETFEGTRLFPLRRQTEAYNLKQLKKIDSEEVVLESIYSGQDRYIQSLKKNSPLAEKIVIKEGCLVMLRQNDPKQRWVNGSTGIVREINQVHLQVELLSGRTVKVERTTFSMLNAEGLVLASVTNFPISLAYAATIHKAQGMTLDSMAVDLTRLWEPGQAYVALSRVTHSNRLRIEGWKPQSIKTDPNVMHFYESICL